MRYTLSLLIALLLLGCGDSPQKSSTEPESSPLQQKTVTEADRPTGLEKTVAPALVKHEKVVKEVTNTEEDVIQKAKEVQVVATVAVDGATLFQKCTSCHGQKAEKVALGKSQIIAGWDVSKLSSAMHGYKDGSYGGAMKALMQGQVKSLSAQEIEALSEYISSL